MRQLAPFSWLSTNGWLVLSGSADALSEIRARALSRCDANGAIAYISLADDLGDALMDDMAELGAASGYLVNLHEADNNDIYERLSSAAMIVVEAEAPSEALLPLLRRTALHAMKAALKLGGLILLEGGAAGTAGQYCLDSAGQIVAGLGLAQNALIAADALSLDDSSRLRHARLQMPDATFVAIAPGSALALGPQGAIETWGGRQVSVSLGNLAGLAAQVERDWAG